MILCHLVISILILTSSFTIATPMQSSYSRRSTRKRSPPPHPRDPLLVDVYEVGDIPAQNLDQLQVHIDRKPESKEPGNVVASRPQNHHMKAIINTRLSLLASAARLGLKGKSPYVHEGCNDVDSITFHNAEQRLCDLHQISLDPNGASSSSVIFPHEVIHDIPEDGGILYDELLLHWTHASRIPLPKDSNSGLFKDELSTDPSNWPRVKKARQILQDDVPTKLESARLSAHVKDMERLLLRGRVCYDLRYEYPNYAMASHSGQMED